MNFTALYHIAKNVGSIIHHTYAYELAKTTK